MALQPRIYTDDIRDVSVVIGAYEWKLIEARVEIAKSDTPDYVDFMIVPTSEAVANFPENPTNTISEGGLLGSNFSLKVDTELSAGPRGDEITTVFTGNLANLSQKGDGSWEGIAWDPSHQAFEEGTGTGTGGNFMNSTIDITGAVIETSSGSQKRAQVSYATNSEIGPSKTKIKASEIINKIIEESPLSQSEVEVNMKSYPGIKIGDNYGGIDKEISFSDSKIPVQKALDRIRKATRSETWFDRDGVFHIGAPEPGNPVENWNLQFIKDTSAGLSTPAWRSVQVIGSGVVSENGWKKMSLNSTVKSRSVETMSTDEDLDTEALAKPVYQYRNLEIQTQAEADATAKKILTNLKDQNAKGKITVLGFPEVRPLDAVKMPESETQPMGGAEYGVVKVVHKINGSDGFLTDIHVGGLTDWNDSVLTSDAVAQESALQTAGTQLTQ